MRQQTVNWLTNCQGRRGSQGRRCQRADVESGDRQVQNFIVASLRQSSDQVRERRGRERSEASNCRYIRFKRVRNWRFNNIYINEFEH